MAAGTGILDFGAFPGSMHATLVVTGQTNIVAGSKVEVWLNPVDSVDHLADEHKVEPIKPTHSTIVAGAGFTAEAFYEGAHPMDESPGVRHPSYPNRNAPMAYGKWNFMWAGDWT